MYSLKKIIKNNVKVILAFILGVVLSSGVFYADTLFSADQVLHSGTTTVKTSLDDLYSKINYGNATAAQILTGKTALIKDSSDKVVYQSGNNPSVPISYTTTSAGRFTILDEINSSSNIEQWINVWYQIYLP